MTSRRTAREQFTRFLALKVQPELIEEIERAAVAEKTTKSEYVRRAVLRQLRHDGFVPHRGGFDD